MKKICQSSLIGLALLFCFILSSCGGDTTPDPTNSPMGNSNSNLSQGGYITVQGETIYRLELVDNKEYGAQLVKSNKDGSKKKVLTDDFAAGIQVLGDWVYYIRISTAADDPDNNAIFRVKTDGSSRSRIGSELAIDMVVFEDWLFYQRVRVVDGAQKVDLVRCGLDGSSEEVLNEEFFVDFQISGDRIIYNVGEENGTVLKSMAMDGTDVKQVVPESIMTFLCDGDWIYYMVDATDYNASPEPTPTFDVYRVKRDGSENSKITTLIGAVPVNISGEWIYCMNQNEGQQEVYRIKLDGSGKETLLDHAVWSVNIIGDRLYYYDNPDASAKNSYRTILGFLYSVNLDGTDIKTVN